MALVIEDGTGKSDAEAIASVAELTDYLAKFGRSIPEGTTDGQKEVALRDSWNWVELKYGQIFQGLRQTSTQRLAFPRVGIYYDGFLLPYIPERAKFANIELAIRLLNGLDINPDLSTEQSVIEETIGPLTIRYTPGEGPAVATFTQVLNLLGPLLMPTSGSIPLHRG